jgi:hypothetical protein
MGWRDEGVRRAGALITGVFSHPKPQDGVKFFSSLHYYNLFITVGCRVKLATITMLYGIKLLLSFSY